MEETIKRLAATLKLLMALVVLMVACTARDSSYPHNIHARRQPITIYVDKDFLDDEKQDIQHAFDAWTRVSDGIIRFDVHWDIKKPYKFSSNEVPPKNQGIFIWQIGLLDRTQLTDDQYERFSSFHGLYIPGFDDSASILLFTDVIPRYHFYQVITHEVGHLLGLSHDEDEEHVSAIMYPQATGKCITKWDMQNLCEIYGCKPKETCVPIIP